MSAIKAAGRLVGPLGYSEQLAEECLDDKRGQPLSASTGGLGRIPGKQVSLVPGMQNSEPATWPGFPQPGHPISETPG